MIWETVPVIITILSNKRKFWNCIHIKICYMAQMCKNRIYVYNTDIYIDNIPMSIVYTIHVYYIYSWNTCVYVHMNIYINIYKCFCIYMCVCVYTYIEKNWKQIYQKVTVILSMVKL